MHLISVRPFPIGFSAQVMLTEPRAERWASRGHLFVAGFGWLSLPVGSAWRGRPQLVDWQGCRNTTPPSSWLSSPESIKTAHPPQVSAH